MAKLAATEALKHVADECLQFHGGEGYLERSPMARLFRDARAATIIGGTSEIMREIIAHVAVDGMAYESIASRPPTAGGRAEDPSLNDTRSVRELVVAGDQQKAG